MTSVNRKVVTALFSTDITDSIKATLDVSWGKVKALNPLSNFQITTGNILGFDNPYLQAVTGRTPRSCRRRPMPLPRLPPQQARRALGSRTPPAMRSRRTGTARFRMSSSTTPP